MKKPQFSDPDSFTLFPMVSLLPIMGKIGKLEALTSSFYARYERVKGLKNELSTDSGGRPSGSFQSALRRHAAEEAMLRQVLDWLEVQPETGAKGED